MEEYEGHSDYGIKIEAFGRKVRRAMYLGLVAIVVVIGIGLLLRPAKAHEAPSGWTYPAACCSQRDCARVPMVQVSDGPEGYRVKLLPGDHNMAPNGGSYLIPYANAKSSGDHEYHICILPSGTVICFFAPPRGM